MQIRKRLPLLKTLDSFQESVAITILLDLCYLCCERCSLRCSTIVQCTARVIRHFPGPCVKYLEEESCEPHQRGDPFGRGHTRPHGNTCCAPEVSVTVQVFLELSSPPGHWVLVHPIITLLSTPSATAPHTPMSYAPAPRCEMSWAALAALTSSPGTVR